MGGESMSSSGLIKKTRSKRNICCLPGEEEEVEDSSRIQQTLNPGTEPPDFEATPLEDGKVQDRTLHKFSTVATQSSGVLHRPCCGSRIRDKNYASSGL
jgi:hypothetical protein